ncbi:MAG: hypothetical protein IPM82_03975 [Saprospiraceae bacterium]|nr:hypothetical protein [Saprospiraceae bacterium]
MALLLHKAAIFNTFDNDQRELASANTIQTPSVGAPGTYCLTVTNTATGCKMTDCMVVGFPSMITNVQQRPREGGTMVLMEKYCPMLAFILLPTLWLRVATAS